MTARKKCDKEGCPADVWAYVGSGTWTETAWDEEALCQLHAKRKLIDLHATPPTDPTAV